ncbi:hypothetical protein O7599_25235 [Streptomyces sp. WMMC500]|uniref:hypothetical protein n=1 Tax=Streptomyces sp. WMMC500 TaxID=3015154 RepID=UPI00248B7A7B|nr:hypothetical protein [Streptomyces sp. WMMC500]WBB58895.1 hypothetical protein O7599_25235 [Streptomyces sp. WMMC500]
MKRRAVLAATAGGVATVGSWALTGTAQAAEGPTAAGKRAADPPTGTVRVFWLRPRDVPSDQRYPDGISGVLRESQRYYRQELGVTFRLNDPVVEVVDGAHDQAWYENTPHDAEEYWWVVFNMQQELMSRFGLRSRTSAGCASARSAPRRTASPAAAVVRAGSSSAATTPTARPGSTAP